MSTRAAARRRRAPVAVAVLLALAPTVDARADTALDPPGWRLAGEDRYATAVAVADELFPDGATTVVVAGGVDLVDAAVAAPVARLLDAPLLLTSQEQLPAATASAIGRLAPTTVVVVGGTAAIGDGVVADLEALVPDVQRIAGDDRFATAGAVADRWFPAEGGRAYLASGHRPLDAATTASAAAHDGAPLLLTDGLSVGSITAATLARLAPTSVVVVGVTPSPAARAQLEALVPVRGVIEVAGVDRYATAALLTSIALPRPVSRTFLASGARAPDAAFAAAAGGAVLLADGAAVTDAALAEAERLAGGGDVHVVGGEAAIGEAVAARLRAATLLAVSPMFVQGALSGVPTTVLVRAGASGGSPLALDVTASAGEVAVDPPVVAPGALAEITFVPPPVTEDLVVVLTVTGTRDGMTQRREREIVVMPDEDTREGDARAVLGLFLPSLAAEHPDLGLGPSIGATVDGSVVAPRLLVVSHYEFLDARWEIGVAWHIMVAPDDWAELYLRPRDALLPTRAFRIRSWSTALAEGTATVTEIAPPPEVVR